MKNWNKWAIAVAAAAAIVLVAGIAVRAAPPTAISDVNEANDATRGRALVVHVTDCMMTFVAEGEELTSIFPAGEGLLQAPLDHNAIFVGIDEDRQQAFLQCHGTLPRGVPVVGFDVATGNTVVAEFVSNVHACEVSAAIGSTWCNPSGRGRVTFTQENTGAPCADYEDWRAVMAPSGQTSLRCWSNLGQSGD